VGPGCVDLVAPRNARIQYYMSTDSSLNANVTCDDGYRIDTGGTAAAASSFLQIRCTGITWSASLPVCLSGTILSAVIQDAAKSNIP